MEKISRRERKKMESRQAILKAAVQEFSKKGFPGTSVADIMNAAELGTGTFYNYFDSKEDILISLLTAFVNRTETLVQKLQREQQKAPDMLSAICLHTADFLSRNRFVLPLFMSAAAHSGLPEDEMARLRPEEPGFRQIFADIIAYGQATGDFRDDIPSGIITELFHSLFQAAAFSSLSYSLEENIELKLRVLLAGIKKE